MPTSIPNNFKTIESAPKLVSRDGRVLWISGAVVFGLIFASCLLMGGSERDEGGRFFVEPGFQSLLAP